jgi:hypothetical protein
LKEADMSKSKLKKAGLVLALATLAVVLGFADPEPVAAINCGTETVYYSDASFTVVVGVEGRRWPKCGCGFYSFGTTSPYSVTGPRDIC